MTREPTVTTGHTVGASCMGSGTPPSIYRCAKDQVLAACSITQGETGTSGLIGRVREGATNQLSRQKERATDGLGSVAQAVRPSTQQLREQQHDTIARYVEQLAQQLETFSAQLKDRTSMSSSTIAAPYASAVTGRAEQFTRSTAPSRGRCLPSQRSRVRWPGSAAPSHRDDGCQCRRAPAFQ